MHDGQERTRDAEQLNAGRQALARGEWLRARSIFERLLEQDRDDVDVLEGLGHALYWIDDPASSFEMRERAYRLRIQRGERRDAARLATGLGIDYADFRGMPVASGWMQRARSLLHDVPESPEHGWVSLWEGHFARAIEHDLDKALDRAADAARIAREQGLPDLELLASALEGLTRVTAGDVDRGMRQLDEATAAAVGGEFTDLDAMLSTCCFLVHACERVWDYERAAMWAERLRGFAREWQIRSPYAACESQHAALLVARGEWEEADELITRAATTLEAMRPVLAPEAFAILGDLRRRQGRHDEALAIFSRVADQTLAILGTASIALERGDYETAVTLLERMRRRALAEKWMIRAMLLELLVRAYLRAGDAEAAAHAAREASEIAGMVGTRSVTAFARLASGACAAATGDHASARNDLEDALDDFETVGVPYEAAMTRLRLCESLSAIGRSSFAIQEARAALRTFERLGAAHDAARARSMLVRLAPAAPGADATELTPREIEILSLVAKGLSDKETGARLRISAHTVHRHVSNIRTKLGLPSRAAAVAHAVQLGLLLPMADSGHQD